MARSLLRSARSSALVLSALAALAALACGSAVDSEAELTPSPSPTGQAGAGGSGATGGSGGSSSGGYTAGGGTGGSSECASWGLPTVSARYLDAGPDAGDAGAGESGAGTPPTDGGALDAGLGLQDAGTDLTVPRRIRVVVGSSPSASEPNIDRLGPGVVLLGEPVWYWPSLTIELLVSTSHPVIDLLSHCGEWPARAVHVELVLQDSSIDVSVSD